MQDDFDEEYEIRKKGENGMREGEGKEKTYNAEVKRKELYTRRKGHEVVIKHT